MPTFNWTPDFEVTLTRAPRVRRAQFGDGYEQRVTDGLNADLGRYQLRFLTRTDSEAAAIDAFLATQGAAVAFDWTPHGGVAGKYVCREWSRRHTHHNNNAIEATFEQVAA